MSRDKDRSVVVRRAAPARHVFHGGAWKLAYADFMTAMMAFFLMMWLLSSASTSQLRGIAEYFNQPLKLTLWGGERSAEDSSVLRGGGRDISSAERGVTRRDQGLILHADRTAVHDGGDATAVHEAAGGAERREQARLHDLQIKLAAALEANPEVRPLRQQIRIDSTLTGLRIEIVDSQKRPMFATAEDVVEPYMRDILRAIGRTLNDVPNHIVVQGHTDAVPYAGGEKGYSNWELSADRANASRRELVAGGMDEGKVLRVLGLASTQNLDQADPYDPANRRISIIVLNRKSEEALMREDSTTTTLSDGAPAQASAQVPAQLPARERAQVSALPALVADAASAGAAPARAPAPGPGGKAALAPAAAQSKPAP